MREIEPVNPWLYPVMSVINSYKSNSTSNFMPVISDLSVITNYETDNASYSMPVTSDL